MVRDPVCGMEIKNKAKAEKAEYNGKIYFFCTPLCKIQFEQEPEKYLKNEENDENKR